MIKFLTALMSLHFLLLCSCATSTEENRYEREDRFVLAREDFYRQSDFCRSMGGSMQITSRTLGEHTYHDYKLARCVKYR